MKKPALKPELKMGADRKRLFLLGGLLVVAGVVYYINSSSGPESAVGPQTAPRVQTGRIDPAIPVAGPGARVVQRPGGKTTSRLNIAQRGGGTSLQEFRPTLKFKDPIDPARVDPTLKLGLLARLRSVSVEGTGRSLFDFSGAPPPDAPKAAIAKVKPIIPGAVNTAGFIGPVQEKPAAAAPAPPKPPPPPIPLKFYGFTTASKQGQGPKRAFFLEGEDIFVAGEGDLIKNRYKVLRIGVNSAVIEDTTHKHQQTLPLEAEQVNS